MDLNKTHQDKCLNKLRTVIQRDATDVMIHSPS